MIFFLDEVAVLNRRLVAWNLPFVLLTVVSVLLEKTGFGFDYAFKKIREASEKGTDQALTP